MHPEPILHAPIIKKTTMNRYFGLHSLEGEWHALLPRYILLADRLKGKRVLDIGCGTGIGSSLMLELGAEMVDAIDHRPAVLELGRMKHAKQGLDFHVMFWEELNFPDDTFDLVVCMDPSSPVTDPSLVSEVRRVLKADGEYVCAVERTNISGLEAVLPRYGYTDGGESVNIHGSRERVPQIGELQSQFSVVQSIVQRPHLSFVFDHDHSEPPSESVRKADEDGESGVWAESSRENGRWIASELRLAVHDEEAASVAIYFCADVEKGPSPLREVQLPYYSLVERLKQVVQDLRTAPMREGGDEDSIFDELIDAPERERHPTNEFKAVNRWEDQPTMIRERPDLSALQVPVDPMTQLQKQVAELTTLYTHVQNEFSQVVGEAQRALSERDHYIEHLVNRIHQWEAVPPVSADDVVQTGEHQRLDLAERSSESKDDLVESPAEEELPNPQDPSESEVAEPSAEDGDEGEAEQEEEKS